MRSAVNSTSATSTQATAITSTITRGRRSARPGADREQDEEERLEREAETEPAREHGPSLAGACRLRSADRAVSSEPGGEGPGEAGGESGGSSDSCSSVAGCWLGRLRRAQLRRRRTRRTTGGSAARLCRGLGRADDRLRDPTDRLVSETRGAEQLLGALLGAVR